MITGPSVDRTDAAPPPTASPADKPPRSGAAPPAPVLDVHDVTVAYHRKPVLWDVDLTVDRPCLAGIVGPIVFTQTFATFIAFEEPWHWPGAPFLLAAALLVAGLVVARRVPAAAGVS